MIWRNLHWGASLFYAAISCTCAVDGGCLGRDLPKFPEPPILRSEGGVLSVQLELKEMELAIPLENGTVRFATRAFNGMVPGPTMVARPGDVLNISLVNSLGANAPVASAEMPNIPINCTPDVGCTTESTPYAIPNSTNLHTHGLHTSPLQPGDNVLDVAVQPGGPAYEYSHRLPPDHNPGVFWYHPHLHRSVALQTAGGAAGAIIIEEEDDRTNWNIRDDVLLFLQTVPLPALRGLQYYSGGRLLNLSGVDWPVNWRDDMVVNNQHPANAPFQQRLMDNIPLVNGHSKPVLHLEKGTWRRLRFIHAGAFFFLDLSLEPDGGSASQGRGSGSCELELLATDGIPLMETRSVRRVVLAPGGRADVAVRCSGHGKWRLASGERPGTSGMWNPDMYWAPVMMRLIVHDDSCSQLDLPLALPTHDRPHYLRDLRNISRIEGHFNLSYKDAKVVTNLTKPVMRFPLNGDSGGTCTFNGRIYSRNQSLTQMRVGTVQEWRVDGVQGHPFHMHVNPYQVVEIWGGLVENACDAEYGAVCIGDWHDTLQVPHPQNTMGATLRFVTDRFLGESVVHCHYLNHEDLGCIGLAEIVAQPHFFV